MYLIEIFYLISSCCLPKSREKDNSDDNNVNFMMWKEEKIATQLRHKQNVNFLMIYNHNM